MRRVSIYVYIDIVRNIALALAILSNSESGSWAADVFEMSHKRHGREEGASIDEKRFRKSHSFRGVVLEVINLIRMQNLMIPLLEPVIRRVVKEEVDSALRKYIVSMKRSYGKDARSSDSRTLQLQFSNDISLPVFTGTRIESEGGSSIEVSLVDVLTGQVVSSGPGSTANVEIVVLEGDFDGNEEDDWICEEFNNNIVREREGKKPLLTGDVILTLKDGKGSVGDVSFTDNSSWTRSRKFRLGARLIDDNGGIRIREARSDPFIVRDHRGELYKKHHPPSLSDEVWRLEKIGKDGAFHKRLSKEGVRTVHDFLLLLSLDPTRLRNILGTGMSAKKWEVTVEHARTCVLDKKLYLYNNTATPGNNGIVFNAVGQVVGMFSGGQYVTSDKLSDEEKVDARELVTSAFRYREKIVVIDESYLDIPTSSRVSNVDPSSNMISEGSFQQDSTSHNIGRSNYSQEVACSPDFMQSLYPLGASNSVDYYLPGFDPMDIRYDQPLGFPGQVVDTPICDSDTMTGVFSNDHLKYFEPGFSLPSPLVEPSSVPMVSSDKTHKGWNILACMLRWRFYVKRIVSRKRPC